MRLLIIECSNSKLPAAITLAAGKMIPKPEMISTMNIDLSRFNVPEFKSMLNHLAPDTIVLNPPTIVPDNNKWVALVQEALRNSNIMSGRLFFISNSEALGDSENRTEGTIEMPYSDIGTFIHMSETMIESYTSRHYIVRFPYTIEHPLVHKWVYDKPDPDTNQQFTLISLSDIAQSIIDMIQTGWFGKFHVTPNDFLVLSHVTDLEWDRSKKITNYGVLISRQTWKVATSREVWNKLIGNRTCEVS